MVDFGDSLVLVGVPVAALTALAVQAFKRAGLNPGWVPWCAVLTAMTLAGLAELIAVYVWLEPVGRVIASGLILGLASSGGYSWMRQIRKEG